MIRPLHMRAAAWPWPSHKGHCSRSPGAWLLASTTITQVHVGFRLRWGNKAGHHEACRESAPCSMLPPGSGVLAAPRGRRGHIPAHPRLSQATWWGLGPGLLIPGTVSPCLPPHRVLPKQRPCCVQALRPGHERKPKTGQRRGQRQPCLGSPGVLPSKEVVGQRGAKARKHNPNLLPHGFPACLRPPTAPPACD